MFADNNSSQSDRSYDEYLDFEYLEIGEFQVNTQKAEIKIEVYNLIIMDRHPQYSEVSESDSHMIVFSDVTKSKRQISKYKDGDCKSSDFESTQTTEDKFATIRSAKQKAYYLDGVLQQPCAWLAWDIEAATYTILPST